MPDPDCVQCPRGPKVCVCKMPLDYVITKNGMTVNKPQFDSNQEDLNSSPSSTGFSRFYPNLVYKIGVWLYNSTAVQLCQLVSGAVLFPQQPY